MEQWAEREEQLIDQALSSAGYLQYKLPGEIDYLEYFVERMEQAAEERSFIYWWHREGKDYEPDIEDPNVRAAESLSDLFCDDCDSFQMRVGVLGEKHICGGCWEEHGYRDQEQLTSFDLLQSPVARYAVVGCGSQKQDRSTDAAEMYTSPYFRNKREFAEELTEDWCIVSAEYGVLDPGQEIEPYDTTVEDVDVDLWLQTVATGFDQLGWADQDRFTEAWVLVGKRYLDREAGDGRTLRRVINESFDRVKYPFQQTSGIGKQQEWLKKCVRNRGPAMPYDLRRSGQQTLSDYG